MNEKMTGSKRKIKNPICALFMFASYTFKQSNQEQHPEEQHTNSNSNQGSFKHQC